MERFTLPRDIYFGKNSLEHLKDLDAKKAVVVDSVKWAMKKIILKNMLISD